MGPRNIAKVFAEKKNPRPSVYRYENDGVIIQKTDITDRYSWATKTIVGMLENEVYLGHTVNCKTTTIHENDKDNHGTKYEIDIFLTHIGKFW